MSAGVGGAFKARKMTINSPKSQVGLTLPLKVMNINIKSGDELETYNQLPKSTKNITNTLLLKQNRVDSTDFAFQTEESTGSMMRLKNRKISVNDFVTHKYPNSRVISPTTAGFRRRNVSNAYISGTNMKSGPLTCTSIGGRIQERNTDLSTFSSIRPKSSIT